MKKLDAYIIKSFLKPFFATFFIILFVLVMQAVWLGFDQISGKGVGMNFILKFIGYLALTVVPMAMPIGILLSAIMALGNFSEHYEFAAIKSAGISLRRFMLPLILLTVFMSGINFLFLNYVFPHASLKQKNMFNNVKKKQPALALIPDAFNTEIPGYIIKFDEKYGEEGNFLKNVQIADLSSKRGKIKVITAKDAEITTEEGSKYMTFILKDGNYYEEHSVKGDKIEKRKKMPASKATFKRYTINIDVSSFSNEGLEDAKLKTQQMYSLKQLKGKTDTIKKSYDSYLKTRAISSFNALGGKKLIQLADSIKPKKLNTVILENFELKEKVKVITNAEQIIERQLKTLKNSTKYFKERRKYLNLYDLEFHSRIAFAFSCLVLFFIGAPLGSIIRKGGFGLPMVVAIFIFVIYFFISSLGKNLAEESVISAALGGWLSTIILLPFGFFLTRRAAKDMGIINFSNILDKIQKLLTRLKAKTTN